MFQLSARGRVSAQGLSVSANGAFATGAPNIVNPGAAGDVGNSGAFGSDGPGQAGGNGGDGGAGGSGGDGGAGNRGGGGGSGGGGTIKLVGTELVFSGSQAQAANGRVLVADNTAAPTAGLSRTGTLLVGAGPRTDNPFVKGGDSTALIADVQGGAEAFGLLTGIDALDNAFATLLADAPESARAALLRLDIGPGAVRHRLLRL